MRIRMAVTLLGLICAANALAGAIDRVEPPFWWQGFRHTELQILVHGDRIGASAVSVDYPGVTLERTVRVASDNYLFLYLDIDASAKPGAFNLVFDDGESRIVRPYELQARDPEPAHARGFSAADAIYLVTPDRFANGDPSNDAVAGYGDAPSRTKEFGRHGGDLAGVRQHLDYIADMGFTMLWLNPVLENAMPEMSYHGYAITDFYKVDPRFGSNEEYRTLSREAAAKGIGLIMDVVTNHCGSEHWWMHDLPSPDWLNFPDSHTVTTHARTANEDPYASDYDRRALVDGWFVDAMPDLNETNPLLADYLIQNAIWWIEYAELSGIRMDTMPYNDKEFMARWGRRILEEYPDFTMTGEEYSANPAIVSYWQRGNDARDGYRPAMPSMLDFPLQIALSGVLTAAAPDSGSVWTPAYEILGNDFLYARPDNLVIFADNHDMSRVYTQLGEDPDLWRMAMAYILTMRGIPQIYYGTEVLMANPGTTSHDVIRSEFPGGWPDSKANAFTDKGLSSKPREALAYLRRLLNWRKGKAVIHTGNLMQYTPVGDVYAYFRYDDRDTVMVVFNRGEEPASVDTARFSERLAGHRYGEDVVSGKRYDVGSQIDLPPRSVLILEVE
ncbi:MAG: glycoside hydrolase family 13 protein [Woeseiaceae bacterium]